MTYPRIQSQFIYQIDAIQYYVYDFCFLFLDVDLNNGYKQLGTVVILLCTVSLIISLLSVIFGLYLFVVSLFFYLSTDIIREMQEFFVTI